jgi:hypothetical protein
MAILAEKALVEKELSQQILVLRWKELQYLYQNAQNLATTSAVLVGFGIISSGAIGIHAYDSANVVWHKEFEWTAPRAAGVAAEFFIGVVRLRCAAPCSALCDELPRARRQTL